MCKVVRNGAHEHTGSAETLRPSLRNGFTAYAALTSATNSSCHRHRWIKVLSKPGWARKTSTDLTSATDARSTRFCRTQPPVFAKRLIRAKAPFVCMPPIAHEPKPALPSRVTPDAAASTATRPAFVTLANAPLSGTGCRGYRADLREASRYISENQKI